VGNHQNRYKRENYSCFAKFRSHKITCISTEQKCFKILSNDRLIDIYHLISDILCDYVLLFCVIACNALLLQSNGKLYKVLLSKESESLFLLV
jgi:hypothetical protein